MDTRLDDLPPMFSKKGEWLGYDPATLKQLTPDRRELYDRLADAVTNVLQPREAAKQAAQDRLHSLVAELRDLESMKPAPMTQTQLAKEWIASQRRT